MDLEALVLWPPIFIQRKLELVDDNCPLAGREKWAIGGTLWFRGADRPFE